MLRVVLPALVLCLAGTAHADGKTKPKSKTKHAAHKDKSGLDITKVDGVAVEVHTAKAYRTMAKAAHKAGVDLGIRSGYRTYDQQAHLYELWQAGKGNPAAPPGMSNHENGRALDIKLTDPDARKWLEKHADHYGFHATVNGEPWHYEYIAGSADTKKHATHARR